MKKIVVISAVCAVLILGIFLFFGNSSSQETPMPETVRSQSPTKVEFSQEAPVELQAPEPVEQPAGDDIPITKEQFESLPAAEQQEMLEEFVADFWDNELGVSDETNTKEKRLSLEIFGRPYIRTLTDNEFALLSPEDREKAMDEIVETCHQIRSHVLGAIAEGESHMADSDYIYAEACYIYSLEIGRELSFDKEGMLIARSVGIAIETAGLNRLEKLYKLTGDNSKIQMVREQLSQIEIEVEEIRKTAMEIEAKG